MDYEELKVVEKRLKDFRLQQAIETIKRIPENQTDNGQEISFENIVSRVNVEKESLITDVQKNKKVKCSLL